MIINTNPVPLQQDYGPEEASPVVQHHYNNDGQYLCQTYPEDPYQYPPHPYTSGATTAEFCGTWTTNHRFFVNGGDVNYHAVSSSRMSPSRVESYYSHNPLESSDTHGGASFYVNGHHHHLHHHHHHQHQPPSHYYPMASSHSDVNSHFGPHEMSCERGADLLMTEKCQQKQADGTTTETSDKQNLLPDPTRIGATERERTRMHMLNDAFDDLRKVRAVCMDSLPNVSS